MRASIIAAGLGLSLNTAAHMFIQQPPPIPGSNSKSPLLPSGANFPCQGATLTAGTVTNMTAGSSQPLQFDLGDGANTAVHGGGSCQVSITYETDATAQKNPSNWKVLHSWIGGCPTNAPGNLDTAKACTGTTDGTDCVDQSLTFTVPQEVKAGNAILGWTWFNNIGNREMYMNCARVSIIGGNGNIDSLPAMFTANIGNGCATTESKNLQFPAPGNYVTMDSPLNFPPLAPVGTCEAAVASSGSSGNSTSSSPASAAPAAGASAPASSASAGAFAEGAGSSSSTLATVASAAPSAASAAPAAASSPAAGASTSACTSGQVACTASGFYCISATQFGMCAYGCAVPMDMASGTACTNGAVSAIVVGNTKRHAHRRHANAHKRFYFF